MKSIKKVVALVLLLIAAFSLCACGKKSEAQDDMPAGAAEWSENEDDTAYNGDSSAADIRSGEAAGSGYTGESGEQMNTEEASKGQSLGIYRVGEDKMAFLISGDMSKIIYDAWISIVVEEFGNRCEVILGRDMVSFFGENVGSLIFGYDSITSQENYYIASVEDPGLCKRFPTEGDLVIMTDSGDGEMGELLRTPAQSVIKDITEEECKKAIAEFTRNIAPEHKAQADWTGAYVTDGYGDFNGYIEADVMENGRVHFVLHLKDGTEEFYLEESSYSNELYDGYEYILASCPVDANDPGVSRDFQYHYDAYYGDTSITYNIDDFSTNEYGDFCNASFYRVSGAGYHCAADDYVDEDRFGCLSEKYPYDSECFVPVTDNYSMEYSSPDYLYVDGDDLLCSTTQLLSYDVNNFVVGCSTRYVFETEEEAKKAYDYYVDSQGISIDPPYKYTVKGKVFYKEMTDSCVQYYRDNYKSLSYGEWYVGCHYLYRYTDEDYKAYAYFSKPVSEEEFSVSVEDVVKWLELEEGYYPCKESEDARLMVSLDGNSQGFYMRDTSMNYMRGDFGLIRVHGMTFDSMMYMTGAHEIYVKEITVGEEETTVTEYVFDNIDFDNVEITLDNYKTKTPARTKTYHFDMTKIIEEENYY